jgi:pyrimidine deaminase RibD-like protein
MSNSCQFATFYVVLDVHSPCSEFGCTGECMKRIVGMEVPVVEQGAVDLLEEPTL